MSVETNSEVAREILSFALDGKVWPTGRKYIAAEWVDKSEEDEDLRLEPLAADWAPDIPPENVVSSEDIQEVLYQAAQTSPETGLPLFPDFKLPIENVRIQGRLQRLGESIPFPIRFRNCIFEDGIHFKDCHLSLLGLKYCRVPFVSLKRAMVERSVVIEHCIITHGINLRGAQIGGLLGLKHARLSGDGENHPGLDLRNAHIGSGVFLRYGFRCDGLVDLSGATIIGSLDCGNGQFHCKNNKKTNRPISLRAKNASIGGSVFLNKKFSATGEVDFRRAKIGAQVTVRKASLIQNNIQNKKRKSWTVETRRFFALNFENATIAQDITLANLRVLEGDIGLQGATAKTFTDNPAEWPDKHLDGKIWLSGFKYDFISRTHGNIQARVKWLNAVLPKHYSDKYFVRQPWEHLAGVLKLNGEYSASNALFVAAERQGFKQSFRSGKSTTLFGILLDLISKPYIRVYYWFMIIIKFGYGPGFFRIISLLTLLLFINITVFGIAANLGYMKPAEEEITVYMETHASDKTPDYYVHFNTFFYSLDLIVPYKLGQSNRWTPMTSGDKPLTKEPKDPISRIFNKTPCLLSYVEQHTKVFHRISRALAWISISAGWISFILVGAAFAGQFRRDRN